MEIKVGQYIRFDNSIMIINKVVVEDKITWLYCDGGIFKALGYEIYKDDIVIKDTPQELIEVGDLVEAPYEFIGLKEIIEFRGKIYGGVEYDGDWKNYTITKILTPHGKDYICQWESK